MKFLLSLIFVCVSFYSFSQKKYYHEFWEQQKKGILCSDGTKITPPIFSNLGKFYNHDLSIIDTVAVFSIIRGKPNTSNSYYKFGLVTNKGKILLPDVYDKLVCNKGVCIAQDSVNGSRIINYNNQFIEKIEPYSIDLRDSIIIINNSGQQFFRKIGTKKLTGPYSNLRVDTLRKLVYGLDFREKQGYLFRYDGSVFYRSKDYYPYYDNVDGEVKSVLADDIILKVKNDTITSFTDLKNSKDFFFKINHNTRSLPYMPIYCVDAKGKCKVCSVEELTIFDILKKMGKIDDHHYYDYSINDDFVTVVKNKRYAYAFPDGRLATSYYDLLGDHFGVLKSDNGKIKYSVLINNEGKIIYKTKLEIVQNFPNEKMALAKKQGTENYYFIHDNEEVKIKRKFKEVEILSPSFHSNVNTLITNTNNGNDKYFVIDKDGNVKDVQYNSITNFYKNRAYAVQDGNLLLVDEKLQFLRKFNYDRVSISTSNNFSKFGVRVTPIYKGELLLNEEGKEIIPIHNGIHNRNDLVYETDTHYGYSGNYTNYYNYLGENIGSKDPEKNDMMKKHKNYYVLIFDYQCHYYDNEGNFIGLENDVALPCRKDRF